MLAAKTSPKLIENPQTVQQQNKKSGFKPSIEKCLSVQNALRFLGQTISPFAIATTEKLMTTFLKKRKTPVIFGALQRFIAFVIFYQQLSHKLANKLVPCNNYSEDTRHFISNNAKEHLKKAFLLGVCKLSVK